MYISIAICIVSFFGLLALLRRDAVSLGLPVAYLFSLLLIHVPGAYAYLISDQLVGRNSVEKGIEFTAIGSVSFVAGVLVVSLLSTESPIASIGGRHRFAVFCLFGGWLFNIGLIFLPNIPSFSAAIDKAGAIWMLGVMVGLRSSLQQSNPRQAALWGSALLVYPVAGLVFGGFLSYGSAAMIIVLAILLISIRGKIKVIVGLIVGIYLGMTVFVNYFEHRRDIRKEAWSDEAPLASKIDAAMEIVTDFQWFDSSNKRHLFALTERLNQNYFAGRAAIRIQNGVVDYLYGRSIWEGLISLVPRVVWPDKPVTAGSPEIVSRMTGLKLNKYTSFGVGNVMEFQINFGIPGLICGFFLLGMLLRMLDRRAAVAERRGDFGITIVCFLPAVALIQPNGSLVELFSGGAAAWVGGMGWKWAWEYWSTFRTSDHDRSVDLPTPGALHLSRE